MLLRRLIPQLGKQAQRGSVTRTRSVGEKHHSPDLVLVVEPLEPHFSDGDTEAQTGQAPSEAMEWGPFGADAVAGAASGPAWGRSVGTELGLGALFSLVSDSLRTEVRHRSHFGS